MCGRYTGYVDDCEELKTIYTKARIAYPRTDFAVGEIFPTNTVPLLTGIGGELRPFAASWGFPGVGGKGVIINARAETAAEKPMFAESFAKRRCIVPATGYYEWTKDKTRYLFQTPGRGIIYLGALWRRCEDGVRFVILTVPANRTAAMVHDRMPVVLDSDSLTAWSVDLSYALGYVNRVMPELVGTEA